MKNTLKTLELGKLANQAERLACQIKFLTAGAESACSMSEDELDGLAIALGHALDDAEALSNTIALLKDGPSVDIAPFPATFAKPDNGNGKPVIATQPA